MTSKPTCEAVIFDMDGLMIDSEILWQQAEIECFATVGITLTIQDCIETTGIRIRDIVELRYNQKPWNEEKLKISRDNLSDTIVNRTIELVKTKGQPKPGLKHALDFCFNKGYKLAIASSSSISLIEATLVLFHFVLFCFFVFLFCIANLRKIFIHNKQNTTKKNKK